MEFTDILNLVIQLCVSLAALIPLVVELVKYVKLAIKEKNWRKMVDLAISLIGEAEEKFKTGAERKEWVVGMVSSMAESINYDIDKEALGNLIDTIVALTKKVNVETADTSAK